MKPQRVFIDANIRVARRKPPTHERAQPPPGADRETIVQSSNKNEIHMLTTDFKFLDPRYLEAGLADKLRGLADDIARFQVGVGPTPEQLEEAPMLVDWHYRFTPLGVRLVGSVLHHPTLSNGLIMTSQVWVADPRGLWARSVSRYYRLGDPRPSDNEQKNALTDDFDGKL